MKKTTLITCLLLASMLGRAQDCLDTALYKKPTPKDTYNIAYLLPLDLDVAVEGDNISPDNFEKYSKYNYNIYQGARIALDEIESQNPEIPYIEVNIIDTKSQTDGLEKWLQNGLSGMDMILSALSRENIDVSKKLKDTQTPLIAITSLSVQSDDYPYYIQVQPTLSTHCQGLRKHITQNLDTSNINLITIHSNSDVSKRALEYADLQDHPSMEYTGDNSRYMLNLKLNANKVNVIFASLLNTELAINLLRNLESLTQYKFVVYGMPTWSSINTHEFTSDMLSVYFSTGFYKHSDTKGAAFNTAYSTKYGGEPNTFAFKGYETTKYFIDKLINHPDSNLYLQIYHNPAETINDYSFEPVCSESDEPQYWENKNLYFIKGSDGDLHLE